MRQKKPLRADPLAMYSPRLLSLFGHYLRWYAARHFNAVRISQAGSPPRLGKGTVLYSNHPSWWDPVMMLLVATQCYPEHQLFAPMDDSALARYPMLGRLGLFGIELGTTCGAATFLDTAERVLDQPNACLCVTAEGRFTDPRRRPIRLQGGVARVLERRVFAAAIPVAIEYVFWNERAPEALLRFGTATRPDPGGSLAARNVHLEGRLQDTMDALAKESQARDERAFRVLVEGRKGVSRPYDFARRLGSWMSGRRFDPSHDSNGRGMR